LRRSDSNRRPSGY